MRQVRLYDDVRTIPIAQVAYRMQNSEDQAKRGIHEKIYGKTSRRQAIAKLRDSNERDRRSSPERQPQNCCSLTDIMANHAAEIHDQSTLGRMFASRPKIAADKHSSFVKLDVDNVGRSAELTKTMQWTSNTMAVGSTATGKTPLENVKTSNAHDEDLRSDVSKIRGYLDLLDAYSLHHFVIWQGKVIRDTPEFTSLARTHQAGWSSMDRCVSILEEIMTVNAVPLAVIDGKKLGELARFDLERVDEADLCSAIANLEQIRPLLRHTRLAPNGPSAAQLAAVTIQATARGYLQRSRFLLLKSRHDSAIKLQCLARGRRARQIVGGLLLERRRAIELTWKALQDALRGNWESWRNSERVLILLPFPAAGEPERERKISQMHWLVDPNVHAVCVLPCEPDEVVLEYHRKILEMSGLRDTRGRMTVVVPENVDLFHRRLPLASLLLYSPGCLKRISRLIRRRPAMILSGETSWQTKRLAVALGAPLLSADPSVALLLQTQSGQKRLFAAADVSAPIGAHDVYDEEDLMVALTKLIACNLEVRRWHIKVDFCQGNSDLAILDTSSLACVSGLKREKAQLERANGGPPGVWHHPDVQLLARARLLKTLRRCLHHVVSICNRAAYPSWAFFLRNLRRVGGVIEAEAPENQGHALCSAFISPTGEISCLAEAEILFDEAYQQVGCLHPQECVSPRALRGATVAVCRELCARGVMGYVSIHFTVFWDERAAAPRLWATGLELGLSVSAFSFCFFRSLTKIPGGGREVVDFGCYKEAADGEERRHKGRLHYIYLDHVHHPSLRSIQVALFFKLCRLEGVSFDLSTQIGTIFNLVDSLAYGTVGVLVTAQSREATLEKARDVLKFVRRIAKERFAPGETPLSKEMWSIGQHLLRAKAAKKGQST